VLAGFIFVAVSFGGRVGFVVGAGFGGISLSSMECVALMAFVVLKNFSPCQASIR